MADVVAAFDFDGTLVEGHTMVPFLVVVHGWPRVLRTMAAKAMTARSRDALKVAGVGALFSGMAAEDYASYGSAYAERLHERLRPSALERLRWHQEHDHRTVIVSASLSTYLRPVARALNVDGVLGVELVQDRAGVLTGLVEGGINNRGPNKVKRLMNWVSDTSGPRTDVALWAYGDDAGDLEMLDAADHAVWIQELMPDEAARGLGRRW